MTTVCGGKLDSFGTCINCGQKSESTSAICHRLVVKPDLPPPQPPCPTCGQPWPSVMGPRR